MLKNDIIRLVKTLSSIEKRNLKLYCKKQSVSRAYLILFDMIDEMPLKNIELLEQNFNKLLPDASFDTTAKYLLKIITDSLIQSKLEKDNLFQQLQTFMRAKVLHERSLIKESLKELHKAQKLSENSQNHLLAYLSYREELNVLSGLNFREVDDKAIIEMQMTARNILRTQLQVHEHHSLYELLKYRLIHTGKSLSEHDKKQLNDLLLSELSLVTNKVAQNFESKKLHLLFQSFFFTSVGDYKSALKTFSELNELFESSIDTLSNPPFDYLSSLEGIMDSLRTIKAYDKIPFYIDKVHNLINPAYTEQFNLQAKNTVITFRLNLFIANSQFREALAYMRSLPAETLKEAIIVDYEKHCELLFYMGLAHFGVNEWEMAIKYINKITLLERSNFHFPIYKAAKLLGVLIHYELGNNEYLHYEIRSYKRSSKYKSETLKVEKLAFKAVMLNPNRNSIVKNKVLWKKLGPTVQTIQSDKFEMQVLKFYDFANWIEVKFTSKPTKASTTKDSKPAA